MKCEYCGQEIVDIAADEAFGFFWHVRDLIAAEQGQNKDDTRYDLQYTFGIRITWDEMLNGHIPRFEGTWIQYKGQDVFFKSLKKYTTSELDVLVQLSKVEAGEMGIEL